jgi:hypothetical protein
MAFQNKKSILQPSSTEAQGYRLKYSNLVSRADQTLTSVGAGAIQPARVGAIPAGTTSGETVRGGGSTGTGGTGETGGSFFGGGTGRGGGSTGTGGTVEEVIKNRAGVFTGANYFTGSAAGNLNLNFLDAFEIALMVKLPKWPLENPVRKREVLFYLASGSSESTSLEISLADSIALPGAFGIHTHVRHNGGSYVSRNDIEYSNHPSYTSVGSEGNGYTLILVRWANAYKQASDPLFGGRTFLRIGAAVAGQSRASSLNVSNINASFLTSLQQANRIYLGGSLTKPPTVLSETFTSSSFSGSIAYVAFITGSLTADEVVAVRAGSTPITQVPSLIRAYTFTSVGIQETTGSFASYSAPLGYSGSVAYTSTGSNI